MKNNNNNYICLQKLFAPLYLSFLLHHLTISITGKSPPPPYTPEVNLALDCGSPNNNDTAPDGRVWIGDVNSNFFPLNQPNNASVISKAVLQPSTQVDRIPYYTARLSHSQFTYTFSVTTEPKFIRLHFYPASYPGFNRFDGFFSVKAGRYTLLSNFSAALTADDLGLEGITKEFFVNVYDNLTLTFTPSPGVLHAYAFINGIEIVSLTIKPRFVRQLTPEVVGYDVLETMHRINIGGRSILPQEDTGMFRSWSRDDDYIMISNTSVLPDPVNASINLNFSMIASYIAPVQVYTTARTMGINKTLNQKYNLTWEFPVDSGFNYHVRLHFCEFQPEIQKPGDRVFSIFIANTTADVEADVIKWSGGNGVPIYKDYVVMIKTKDQSKKKQNLSIQLHSNPEWMTKYSDAILNGIEIFKLSNVGDLTGSITDLPVPPPVPVPPSVKLKPKNRSKKKTVLIVIGGVVSGIIGISLLCFLIFHQRRRVGSWWGLFNVSRIKSKKKHGSSLPFDLCRQFSIGEIKAATNNFDKALIVGVGGFGNVYKGFIDGGATPVAIKRLNLGSQQGELEFKTEIELLSQLRHLHLVSLIGYCDDNHEMILVYDCMVNGTLRDHLYNTDNPPLSWNQRLKICIGAAHGLHYLHKGVKHMIIHRDVKTTNILLDEKWVAKVSDFGLSKMGPSSMSKTHVSTLVKGSFGYLDPEYFRRLQLTEKSDVYSFGVVLLEVLCARAPINLTVEDEDQVNLAGWARQCYNKGMLDEIIDPYLMGVINPECLKKFGEIAVSCLLDEGITRPSMSDVVWGLEFALKLQEGVEENIKFGGYDIEMESEEESLQSLQSLPN